MDTKEYSVKETVATLKGIPTEEELTNQLRTQVMKVTFLKLDGEQRIMTCTKSMNYIPEAKRPKSVKESKAGTVNVWDLTAQDWRSFRYDRVQAVEPFEYIAAESC